MSAPRAAGHDAADALAARVVRWQRVHGRHGLPWQDTRDPYRVWLSEVMLQQTQVSTVLRYYGRFLERFATVQALAAAPLDDVLAQWSGLGYYRRARHLHHCAQQVVALHGGAFPTTAAALAELPGIGRSTAAAIAAFCFDERAAILDGNVKRVLTRALGFDGDLADTARERALWARAQALLPPARDMPAYTQGLMDLGAQVCLRSRPRCDACPLQPMCVAHAQGRTADYPRKTRKLRRGQRDNALLWLQRGDAVWLTQRPPRGVWAGLWSLPEWPDAASLAARAQPWPGEGRALPPIRHPLTHFDWTLHVLHWRLPPRLSARAQAAIEAALPPGRWFTRAQALAAALPAPVRGLLAAASD